MSAIHCTNTKARKRQYHNNILLATCCALLTVLLLPVIAQARTYCGKLWNTVIEIDSSYLAFPPEYMGMDVWRDGFATNTEKGCDDEIKAVALQVDWPSMQPSPRDGRWVFSRQKSNIEVVFQAWPNIRGLDVVDNRKMLQAFLEIATGDGWSNERVEAHRQFDNDLQLYVIKGLRYSERDIRDIYWDERTDGTVNIIINCRNFVLNPEKSRCIYEKPLPEYGTTLKILFLSSNLPDRQVLERKSLALLASLIKH